jgi:hypothetical protein
MARLARKNFKARRSAKMEKFATKTLVLVLFALAANISVPRAAFAQAVPTPVPVEPAGGLDPSKLPDVQGLHLGTPAQEAVAKVKSLYPNTSQKFLTTVMTSNWQGAPDAPWVSRINGYAGCPGITVDVCDTLLVRFNEPPSPPRVVSIERTLGFAVGKYPTLDNVKAAVIQKYGPNPYVLGPNLLAWVLDEQGRPLSLPPATLQRKTQCAGALMIPMSGGSTPAAESAGRTAFTDANIKQLMVDPCRVGVIVYANIMVSGQLVTSMNLTMSENSYDTRAYIATQQYLSKLAVAQKQQQMKAASQQATPKF